LNIGKRLNGLPPGLRFQQLERILNGSLGNGITHRAPPFGCPASVGWAAKARDNAFHPGHDAGLGGHIQCYTLETRSKFTFRISKTPLRFATGTFTGILVQCRGHH
jgi:hypothetical protein